MSDNERTRKEYSQYQQWRQSETLTSWDNAATQWLVTDYRRSLLTKNTSDSLTDRLEFSSESVYPVVTAHTVQNQALPGPSRTKHSDGITKYTVQNHLTLEGTNYLATTPLTCRAHKVEVVTMGG